MDLEFTRGDTKVFKFKLQDKNGVDLKLSNTDKLFLTAKRNPKSTSVSFQKTLNNGIELKDDDYYYVTINSDDTAKLSYGTYGYDIEIKTASGVVRTLLIGSITLTEEYTHKGDEN